LTAIVDLEDLQRFYQAVNLGQGSANPAMPRKTVRCSCEIRRSRMWSARNSRARRHVDAPTTRLTNPIDGKRDFIAVAHVTDTPLQLAVTRDEAVALRPWRDEAIRLGLRTLIRRFLGALTIARPCFVNCGASSRAERALREAKSAMPWRWKRQRGHWDGTSPRIIFPVRRK